MPPQRRVAAKSYKPPKLPAEIKGNYEGSGTYTAELARDIAEAYYKHRGSLRKASAEHGVMYAAALSWRQRVPEFRQLLDDMDALFADEVHAQYLNTVLNEDERNPAWKIFFLKNWNPRYAEQRSPLRVQLELTDSTFTRPKVIDGQVIEPAALEPGSGVSDTATGSKDEALRPFDAVAAEADPAKVYRSD